MIKLKTDQIHDFYFFYFVSKIWNTEKQSGLFFFYIQNK